MQQRAALIAVSVALVVLAAVLLAGGLVTADGMGWFYGSIGSSVVAAVALLGAGKLTPAPAPSVALVAKRGSRGDDWLRSGDDWGTGPGDPAPGRQPELDAEPDPEPQPEPEAEPEAEPEPVDEVLFPIADYDDLTTDEVLGLLPQLYSDELDVVEERERQGAARPLVLARLALLRRHGTDADRTVD
jgi:hypothetical protein